MDIRMIWDVRFCDVCGSLDQDLPSDGVGHVPELEDNPGLEAHHRAASGCRLRPFPPLVEYRESGFAWQLQEDPPVRLLLVRRTSAGPVLEEPEQGPQGGSVDGGDLQGRRVLCVWD